MERDNCLPAGAEHGEHTADAVVRPTRSRREPREEGHNPSREHLRMTSAPGSWTGSYDCGAYHTELASHPIREIAEGEHTNNSAGEGDTGDGVAVVVL